MKILRMLEWKLFCLFPACVLAYVISQSQVESCVRKPESLSCALSMLINSIVTTGSNGTESILVSSVVDNTGVDKDLVQPIAINVTKGPVFVRYSLVYVVDVNSKPREVVSTTSLLGCVSDSSQISSNPTCGYVFFRGAPIRYSEGFCCQCSLDQLFGLGSHQRGSVQCNLLTSLFSNGASVHCLRWGPIWYSVFRIMTPTIESNVTVTIEDGVSNNPIRLTLSNQSPVASTSSPNNTINVTARLVGSFTWTRPPTDWGLQTYAVSPNVAVSTSASALADVRIKNASSQDPFRYGMLVPLNNVDLSGNTCNKIGVSFSGFYNDQGSRCSGYIGDCLQNQLDDFWTNLIGSPNTIMNPGVNSVTNISTSLCSSIGGRFVSNDGYRLSCVLSDSSSDSPTQVLIEVNAKNVSIVRNEANGTIQNISFTSNVTALSQTADILVQIRNSGSLQAEFLVAVTECTPLGLILPLAAADISIGPNTTATVPIKVEDSNTTGNVYTCNAILTDVSGAKLSEMKFYFNTTSVMHVRGSQSTDNSTGNAEGPQATNQDSESDGDACDTSCTGFVDVVCFVSHACWSKIGALVGTIGGIGAFVGVMTKFGGWTLAWRLMKSVFCCNGSNKSKRKRRESDTNHYMTYTANDREHWPGGSPYVPPQPFNPYWIPDRRDNDYPT